MHKKAAVPLDGNPGSGKGSLASSAAQRGAPAPLRSCTEVFCLACAVGKAVGATQPLWAPSLSFPHQVLLKYML